MQVLVSGTGGFIGSHVAQRLLSDGHRVFGVDDFSNGKPGNIPDGVEFLCHDLADPDVVEKLPGEVNVILHLAGQSSGEKSFDDPARDLRSNVDSTLNLIRYGIERNARRLVYASSMSVYGATTDEPIAENHACGPLSCYGVSKLAAERYLSAFQEQLPFVAFRIFNVYGSGQKMEDLRQGMASIFLAQALDTGRVTVKGDLDRFRDLIYIDDVVEAWVRAMTEPKAENQVINLGTGHRTTVKELLVQIQRHVEGMSWHVEGGTTGDQSGIYADNAKLSRLLGLNTFVKLAAGIEQFVKATRQASRGREAGSKSFNEA
jgi:UDP-glucose 4-epimerase